MLVRLTEEQIDSSRCDCGGDNACVLHHLVELIWFQRVYVLPVTESGVEVKDRLQLSTESSYITIHLIFIFLFAKCFFTFNTQCCFSCSCWLPRLLFLLLLICMEERCRYYSNTGRRYLRNHLLQLFMNIMQRPSTCTSTAFIMNRRSKWTAWHLFLQELLVCFIVIACVFVNIGIHFLNVFSRNRVSVFRTWSCCCWRSLLIIENNVLLCSC